LQPPEGAAIRCKINPKEHMTMPLTPQDFVSKWKRSTGREKQLYQQHFLDLCELVGHPTPASFDPTATRFGFEMGATKTSGGQGWADVAKLEYFGWEYKGKDADLDKAYNQLLLYRDALQNPPLLIVSDINTIIIRTNYTNLPTRTITLTLDDLLTPDGLKTLKLIFFDPEKLKPQQTVESVTREAATRFSSLADNLRKYGNDNQQIAHFLIRLLFCLFAEDIGLLPEKLFPRLLEQTRRNSNDFARVLKQLFQTMSTGDYFGSEKILHFNGGLFDNADVLPLDGADMDIITDIDSLDWGAIEPSIFGTLFERGLDPSKRSQLGAHYTSREDILLIVEPVLMAPLRREWHALKTECLEIKDREEAGRKGEVARKKVSEKLRLFADKIAAVKVLDPACGSGNFLYVALGLLLDLQNEVINFSDELGAGRFFISVTPSQLYGIEINAYAYELAQMTIQIGYIQWLRENGYGQPAEPILRQVRNIQHMDAVLAYDGNGKPVEPEWPAVDVIIGNPPFLGGSKLRRELGDKYVVDLWKVYENRIPNASDLVCYWFEKARAELDHQRAKRVGLLATQGIRGGANRKVLERIKETGDIFWAQSDREWILDGATVHVSMIGFDNKTENWKLLDHRQVMEINPDLTTLADITQAQILEENSKMAFKGPAPYAPFDIEDVVAQKMLHQPNINNRPNTDVIKRVVSAIDLGQGSRGKWTIYFGMMPIEEASLYEMPFEYVKHTVLPIRQQQKDDYRGMWWQYGRPRPEMMRALVGLKRYIVTPRVSKHRFFVWLKAEMLANDLTIVFARDDDYFFGVLHSKIHELWARRTGTQLREATSGFRYTSTTTFGTFPFPWAPGAEPKDDPRVQAIAQAAKELVEQRDRWLNAEGLGDAEKKKRTLTNLYNARPTWLDLAHRRLDEVVFAAYGWKSNLNDQEVLEKLLELNLDKTRK
jgi:hypothetical protein